MRNDLRSLAGTQLRLNSVLDIIGFCLHFGSFQPNAEHLA